MPMYSFAANHLWQSTVFAAVAGLIALALRGNAARQGRNFEIRTPRAERQADRKQALEAAQLLAHLAYRKWESAIIPAISRRKCCQLGPIFRASGIGRPIGRNQRLSQSDGGGLAGLPSSKPRRRLNEKPAHAGPSRNGPSPDLL
jgi:hypothetical protein